MKTAVAKTRPGDRGSPIAAAVPDLAFAPAVVANYAAGEVREHPMARRGGPLAEDMSEALPKLRRICSALTPCEEGLSYGNPAFRRGKTPFVVLDRYKARSCVWLLIDPASRDEQLRAEGWFPSPYDPRQRALCCALDKVDWTALAPLVAQAHRLAGA